VVFQVSRDPIDLVNHGVGDRGVVLDGEQHFLQGGAVSASRGLAGVNVLACVVPTVLLEETKARLALGGDRIALFQAVSPGLLGTRDTEVEHGTHPASDHTSAWRHLQVSRLGARASRAWGRRWARGCAHRLTRLQSV
jgi:hypothetical protein